jgi:hypothetical protein
MCIYINNIDENKLNKKEYNNTVDMIVDYINNYVLKYHDIELDDIVNNNNNFLKSYMEVEYYALVDYKVQHSFYTSDQSNEITIKEIKKIVDENFNLIINKLSGHLKQ